MKAAMCPHSNPQISSTCHIRGLSSGLLGSYAAKVSNNNPNKDSNGDANRTGIKLVVRAL